MTHLNYIVFGLGNKNYEDFCGMGVKTDRFLEAIGANRIYSLGKVKIIKIINFEKKGWFIQWVHTKRFLWMEN